MERHQPEDSYDYEAGVDEDEYVLPANYSETVHLAMEQASHRLRNVLITAGAVASASVGALAGAKTVRAWHAHHA